MSVEKKKSEFEELKKRFDEHVQEIKELITEENIHVLLWNYFSPVFSFEEFQAALKDVEIRVLTKGTVDLPSRGRGRYVFEGNRYNICRSVLAVVKAYVRDHPSITYLDLKTVFYGRIQGSHGVVSTPQEVRKTYQDPGKRFFMESESIIRLQDGTEVCVCSQWGMGLNYERFLEKAAHLGYEIKKME